MSAQPIRVAVVDDERVVRDGLAMMLRTHEGIEVVGTAGDGVEAAALLRETAVDVLLLDVRMPRMDGLSVLRDLASGTLAPAGSPRVVVLTTFDLDDYVREALTLGAVGFLLKSSPHEEIAEAVRAAASGSISLSAPVMRTVVDGFVRDAQRSFVDPEDEARLVALTPRELEILQLIGEGMSNNDIARSLFLSLHTVKTHVSRILVKTGSPQRGQAAALAHRAAAYIAQGVSRT